MRARLFLFLCLVAILSACVNPITAPVIPSPAPTTSPSRARGEKIPVAKLSIAPVTDAQPGNRVSVTARVEPMILETGLTPSGATFVSLTKWENANLTQMRFCIELARACAPEGEWHAFQAEWQTTFDVDWLGERVFWLGAQFRDANGQPIRAYISSSARPDESASTPIVINSAIDERTPMAAQPAFAQTAVAATRRAYPVSGALVLQNGLCCAGGKVGTTIEIDAAFEASSPYTTVTQMRWLERCGSQTEMNTAPWTPFVKQKIFRYPITTANWVGWTLAVQYRDANGNLSPIYCADISIEGMP